MTVWCEITTSGLFVSCASIVGIMHFWASQLNSSNVFCWDNKRHHLNGRCFHMQESDWLAGLLEVVWELLYSGSSLWWPLVGHRLIYKWDSILMRPTDYWLTTVHICSCCWRCRSATAVLPAIKTEVIFLFDGYLVHFFVSIWICGVLFYRRSTHNVK